MPKISGLPVLRLFILGNGTLFQDMRIPMLGTPHHSQALWGVAQSASRNVTTAALKAEQTSAQSEEKSRLDDRLDSPPLAAALSRPLSSSSLRSSRSFGASIAAVALLRD
jgi:hypothetical protein